MQRRGFFPALFVHASACQRAVNRAGSLIAPCLSRPGSSFAVILRAGVAARAGEPPARVPHAKTVRRTVLSPLLRFCKEKNFAPCAERPKVSPLDSTAFEKAGEILLSGRSFATCFSFPARPGILSSAETAFRHRPQNFILADVGRTGLFLLQSKSRDSECPAAQNLH